MKIYLAGMPRRYREVTGLKHRILFSYFTIEFPDQKWGAKANFRYYANLSRGVRSTRTFKDGE